MPHQRRRRPEGGPCLDGPSSEEAPLSHTHGREEEEEEGEEEEEDDDDDDVVVVVVVVVVWATFSSPVLRVVVTVILCLPCSTQRSYVEPFESSNHLPAKAKKASTSLTSSISQADRL